MSVRIGKPMDERAAFTRMNGLGNEIFVADMRGRADSVTPAAALALGQDAATRFDQIMSIHAPRSENTDYYIEILNADGTPAGACGNGMRCVTRSLSRETGRQNFRFETAAGILEAVEHGDGRISVDMGAPRFDWQDIPLAHAVEDTRCIELAASGPDGAIIHSPSVASMGNPHAIFWVPEDVGSYALDRFGRELEHHPIFPERANISIAQVKDQEHLNLRTWERGAGLTRACGSAACAAAVSGARTGRTGRKVNVTLPGGTLSIEWRDDGHVIMTGPAETSFSGRFDPSTGAWEAVTETA